ncbi:MAG: hypothetical protein WA991_08955 [Ornithinimicrobium sp.]
MPATEIMFRLMPKWWSVFMTVLLTLMVVVLVVWILVDGFSVAAGVL